MSKKANKTMIGGFVVGALALAVASVLVFGSGKFLEKTYNYVLYFEGSVKGLNVGASVVFRGVKIGSVESVVIQADSRTMSAKIPVVIEIIPGRVQIVRGKRDPRRNLPVLIERGLKAQLSMESLVTGQLMIELDFHPDEPVRLVGGDIEYPELPTIPSAFEQITKKIERLPIEEIFNKLSSTLVGIEKLVNDPEVMGTLKSLHLAVEDFRTLIKDVNAQVDPLATSVDNTLKGYHKLARDVDKQVGPLASGIKKAVKGYDKLARDVDRQVEPLSKEIIKALKAFTGAAAQAEKTLRAVRGVVSADSLVTTELTTTLKELSSAARSIRVWANYLERHPEALIRGKGGYRR